MLEMFNLHNQANSMQVDVVFEPGVYPSEPLQ